MDEIIKDPAWPEVYKFAKDDPIEGGPDGIDNLPLKQLETRTETLRAGQRQQDRAIAEVQTRVAEVRTHVTQWTEKLETSPADDLGPLLEAQISAAGILVEQFAKDRTLIDTGVGPMPLPLTEGRVPVKGDDSLDISDTKGLIEGEPYLLFDSAGFTQEISIAQILDPGRVRIAPNLPQALAFPAWIGRTNWNLSTPRRAGAAAGGIYLSRILDLGPGMGRPQALLLRIEGAGELGIEWRTIPDEGAPGDWMETVWWLRRSVGGQEERQYLLPEGGKIRLKMVAAAPLTLHWFLIQPQASPLAEGRKNPHPWPRPRLLAPKPGEEAPPGAETLSPQPVLAIAPYRPPPGMTPAGVVYAILAEAAGEGAEPLHRSPVQPLAAAYTVPDHILDEGRAYRFTAWIATQAGGRSEAAKPIVARTMQDFRRIAPPRILTPVEEAKVEMGAAIELSSFRVFRGEDRLAALQLRSRQPGQEWEAGWTGPKIAPGTPLTLPPEAAPPGRAIEIEARYFSETIKTPSIWSTPRRLTVAREIWLTQPGEGFWEAPLDGDYDLIPVGGGAAGQGTYSGGGAGWRGLGRKTLKAGDPLPYRVGLGGGRSYEGGQASFIGDISAAGGSGFPWGTTLSVDPQEAYSAYEHYKCGQGSSLGGGSRGLKSDPFRGGYLTVSGGGGSADGHGLWRTEPSGHQHDYAGGGEGYWSKIGLLPGAGGEGRIHSTVGKSIVERNTAYDIDLHVGGAGGGGGVLRPGFPPLIGGPGEILFNREDSEQYGPERDRWLTLSTGGAGYGAGGGGEPLRMVYKNRYYGGDVTVGVTRVGAGVQGCIILRKVD